MVERSIEELLNGKDYVLLPTRELYIKKACKTCIQTKPLLSGYLFFNIEDILGKVLKDLKHVKGFFMLKILIRILYILE